jgi:hypothetical protein
MMGVLLRVPELRENLEAATGGRVPDGDKLALILKDWVNGEEVSVIASRHFQKEGEDGITAMTKCGQNLFGRLTQTASWGLGALLAITGSDLSEGEYSQMKNLPSQVLYGVNSDKAITLRLLGVPRRAATKLARIFPLGLQDSLPTIRQRLNSMSEQEWNSAVGPTGSVYRRVWKIMDGSDEQS